LFGWLLCTAKSSGVGGLGAKVTPAVARLPTWLRDVWLRLSEVGGVAPDGGGGGGGGGGGAGDVAVQPESVTTTDVDPSPTVALQVLARKPEALNLKSPSLSALPVAVDSGEVTVIVASALAPLPSTVRVPELSEALLTLTAASAAEVVTVNAARTSSDARPTTLRPPAKRWLECFMVFLPMSSPQG
jgi:hypothetical protein